MLLQQKEDYDYATKTIESLSLKLEQNIKVSHFNISFFLISNYAYVGKTNLISLFYQVVML